MIQKRLAAFAVLSLFALLLIPAVTAQTPPTIEEYRLPDGTTVDAMCVDTHGNVWLVQSDPAYLFKLDPATGTFSRHEIPTAQSNTLFKGMSAEGTEFIWMADQGGQKIVAYDVYKNKFYNFTFPLQLDPADVIAQDNYLWVACNMELGRINIETNELKDYYVDRYDAALIDLVMDRVGNIWFVEYSSGKVGGYYRMDNQVHVYPVPTVDSRPTCVDIDSQGRLWFVESATNKLGMFDTNMNSFREFDMPQLDGLKVSLKRIAVDGDDNVWITDTANGRVVKYYASEDKFVPISLNGSKYYPTFIQADGNTIWVIQSGNGSVAKIRADPLYGLLATPTPTARPTETPSPSPTAKPSPGFEMVLGSGAILIIAKKLGKNS